VRHDWRTSLGDVRAHLLEKVAEALGRAVDFESTVQAGARPVVPEFADLVVVSASELEQEVRDQRPDLPILYMSGYSRDEMMQRGLIAPDRPFLQKPFSADDLSRLVCQHLESRAAP
jgi:DNA-binding NtrC family response regulator